MKSGVFNYQYLPEVSHPVFAPVLTQSLQEELNRLSTSLRKQVRNVVAVGLWLARNKQVLAVDQALAGQLPLLQVSYPKELSFQFKASSEAFRLFTRTLLQQSFYLHENARVDHPRQVLIIKVDFENLAIWEYELSVVLEQITPAVYLKTLLYDRQQLRLSVRKAS